ncbi:MAG: DEAD/DEAH box helicase [Spirochaetaceae bacterium]|jgi:ATP-dependent RNA helicase RhlB|nr:DEAD/DEAH box helicase [Spirochaetaceae bacterium]
MQKSPIIGLLYTEPPPPQIKALSLLSLRGYNAVHNMEFSKLNLHTDLQRGIADAGYVTCMPVQAQVLENAFTGQDLYVQSQTGTGKTAAFLIVIFQRLLTESLLGGKKALIMVPTRELAVQVEKEAKILGKYLPFKVGSFYGGVGYSEQQGLLRDNVQVLVGTPGRVLDLNKSGLMNLMDMAFLVIDEADRMFDMGFYPDLRKLIGVVPPADRRQTMLFSATLNTWVKNLAWEYTKNPYEIEIEPETVTVNEVEQLLYHVHSVDKMRLLLGIMEREQPESAIIFCNTKRYAEIVAKRLRVNGIDCEFIIGDLPQIKRLTIIENVKKGMTKVLVATDVAARGLDIEGLALVVNYDLPTDTENYVHRIGRTARAGKTGRALTFASEQDVYELADIEKYIGKKIPSQIAGEELFGADKSEGLRIRTDFYDDRTEHRRRNPQGRDRSGNSRGRTSGGSSEGGRRPEGRRREEGRGPRRAGPRETGPEYPRQEDEQNLAKLSFEERMAYYRKKYKGGAGSSEGSVRLREGSARPEEGSVRLREGSVRSREGSARPRNTKARAGEGHPRPRSAGIRADEGHAGPEGAGTGESNTRPGGSRTRPDRKKTSRRNGPSQSPQDPGRYRGGDGPARRSTGSDDTKREKPVQTGDTPQKKPGLFDKLLGVFGKKKQP